MDWGVPEGMEDFLKPTKLCDSGHGDIKAKARELTGEAKTPGEASMRIFCYVRDQILFGMDNCDVRASETMKKGVGFCITKTNLQIALSRAAGIPARYHRAILSRNCLKGIISPLTYLGTPKKIWWHPWCECYLSERWIACDSLLDRPLYKALCRKGIVTTDQIPTIDWNGEDDLNTMNDWVLEKVGTSHSLDDISIKVQRDVLPSKFITGPLFRLSNRYTNRLRQG